MAYKITVGCSRTPSAAPLSDLLALFEVLRVVYPGVAAPGHGRYILVIDSLDEALLAAGAVTGSADTIVQLLKTCC